MSSLFNSLGGNSNREQMDPMQAVNQLKSNPSEFLKSRGFNIPDGVNDSDPSSIINGLIRSGQVGNGRFQQVMQYVSKLSRR